MGPVTSVAIVGHGLIGASIAQAIQASGSAIDVLTLDRDDPVTPAARADLIILSAPVAANITNLLALRAIVAPHTLITDVGSTKAAIVAAARGMRFVGGHPIAGAASAGKESADAGLFQNRRWVLTPTSESRAEDLERLRAFIAALGATVVTMDPDEHDRVFAFVSHLPQLTVSALMHVAGIAAGEHLRLAGAGLRDSTRIAGSPHDIWKEIVASNRHHVVPALDVLIATLQQLRDDATGEALVATFESARRFKAALSQSD